MTLERYDAKTRSANGMNRAGFTLIEMVAVMGVTAFILVSTAVTISSLQRLNRKLRDDIPANARVSRLALQFRTDVHSAREMTLEKNALGRSVLRLTVEPDRVMEYRTEQGQISRVARGGPQPEHQETFQLPHGSQVELSMEEDSKSLVSLTIRRPAGKIVGATDDLQTTTILATAGWNRVAR